MDIEISTYDIYDLIVCQQCGLCYKKGIVEMRKDVVKGKNEYFDYSIKCLCGEIIRFN